MKVSVLQKSYCGYLVLDIQIRIRILHGTSTSFSIEDNDSDPWIYAKCHSDLNYPFDGRQPLLEDDLCCKMTFCGLKSFTLKFSLGIFHSIFKTLHKQKKLLVGIVMTYIQIFYLKNKYSFD